MEAPEALLVPLLIGLVQVVKEMGLPKICVPIFTLALGVFLGYFIGVDWIHGLVYGLSALGLWSGAKATLGK